MLVRQQQKNKTHVLNFREVAPAAATASSFSDVSPEDQRQVASCFTIHYITF